MKRGLWGMVILLMLVSLVGAAPVAAGPQHAITEVDAKIQIVWPHGNAPVHLARLANITVYLFEPGGRRTVPCDYTPTVRLWRALNNNPATNVGLPTAEKRLVTRNGVTFPVWDFNGVDVSAATDGINKLYFYVTVDGVTTNFNVWSHGADARTYLPEPRRPIDAGGSPDEVDARIQVVWPHDRFGSQQPVQRATLANVTVALFNANDTLDRVSVGTNFNKRVLLFKAQNNLPMELVGTGVKRLAQQGNLRYPVWDFNDVDVSAARDPLNKYYFRVLVEDTRTFSTIWSHGVDARTYFPTQDQPTGGCGSSQRAVVNIMPTSGVAGSTVRVEAVGFPANAQVWAWAGPENSEWSRLTNGRTNANGVWSFDWRPQGATGQRWLVAVSTGSGSAGDGVTAQSVPFTISGQPSSATLKYYWPNTLPTGRTVDKGLSWAEANGYLLVLKQANGQPSVYIHGGSAARGVVVPAVAPQRVSVRGLIGRAYVTGGGVIVIWEEDGETYAIAGNLDFNSTLELADGLVSMSLTAWRQRLAAVP